MSKRVKNSTEYINFKVPAEMKVELLRLYKRPGELSVAMRSLVQMHLQGKLPPLEYIQTPKASLLNDRNRISTSANTTNSVS
jgi:hypothetical protein